MQSELAKKENEMFHLKDGWFFERQNNGGVKILKRATARDESPVVSEVIIDDAGWASIVASVSHRGETGDTWREALKFHNDHEYLRSGHYKQNELGWPICWICGEEKPAPTKI